LSPSGCGGNLNTSLIDAPNDNICLVPFISTVGDAHKIDVQTYIINPVACIATKIAKPGFGGAGYENGGDGGIPGSVPVSTTAGGGGGGSSFWVPGATNTSMATDTSGTTSVTLTYTPDLTPPAAKPSQSPAANTAGWNTSDVTVTWNWTDTAAGVDSANCTTSSASSGEGVQTLTATCKDLAGNLGSASYAVKVDKTAPTVSAAATSQPNASGWYTAPVTVHFTCSDKLSGVANCPTDHTLSTDGSAVSSTAQTATDAAGNTSTASNVVTVKLDQTAPVVKCATPDGAWHATDMSLGCTSSDATSGLANAADASFQLSTSVPSGTETASAATGSHSVADVSGNTTTAGPLGGNEVDKKAPTITLSQPIAVTYQLNQAVTASYSSSDGGSGVATCAGPVPSGTALDTSTAGSKTFTVTATDNVGNTSSQSVSYAVVAYNFSGFLAPVNGPPTVNTGKLGKVYPVKFQLTDASGAFVSSLSAVKSITYQNTSCSAFSSDPTDALETTTTGSSGLRYDSTANQYVYTWATPSVAGCYTLFVTLDSGQIFPAYFSLS
jgi:hypothetical protein